MLMAFLDLLAEWDGADGLTSCWARLAYAGERVQREKGQLSWSLDADVTSDLEDGGKSCSWCPAALWPRWLLSDQGCAV